MEFMILNMISIEKKREKIFWITTWMLKLYKMKLIKSC